MSERATWRGMRLAAGAVALGCAAVLASCAGGRGDSAERGATAQCDLGAPAAMTPVRPAAAETDHGPLHNVHRLVPGVISGAQPEGPAAFDALKAMGVRTIVSVDGATPAVDLAASRGMRYVHIPTTYAEVTDAQRLELARVLRELPGPVYVHCHHGKHRGPAAVAAAAVTLGMMTPEQGEAFMRRAGTAESYAGLYACVREATAATAEELAAAPGEFPAVRKPRGIVAAMVEVDLAYEHLGAIRAAGWKVPADHPDLVPAAEAGRLADHLRYSGEDGAVKSLGADFERRLRASIERATALEGALAAGGAGPERLEALWKPVAASCKECHAAHRDVRGK